MKRYVFKTALAVILMAFLSLISLKAIRTSQRETQFKAVSKALSVMLSLQASAINDGYFSWSEVQDLVAKGDFAVAAELLSDIANVYPFVNNVSIAPGIIPEDPYEIVSSGKEINLDFSIKDDFGFEALPGFRATVSLDAQAILDALRSESKIVIDQDKGQELAYSIRARFEEPILDWLDFIFILVLTFAIGFPISMWLWRTNTYFYESKGLESIIFLFEQTEKLSSNHSRRVAALSLFLGEKLGYKGKRLRNLYTAALLHDIGKISVPTAILLKDEALTKQEQQAVMAHPIISARILKNFRELSHLSQIVLYHHERFDGTGYPEGLKGIAIPEESRIIAVVDVYEALVGDRPYRKPLSFLDAFEILRSMPLDQRLVEVLAKEFHTFKDFRAPKWVVSYDRIFDKL
jgi:HD-GYP domain-containing protein (c-di-GMP phosphodiesterase class II)